MICKQCGKDNADNAKFCMKCGSGLIEEDNIKSGNELLEEEDEKRGNELLGGEKIKIILNKIKALPQKVLVGGIVGIVILIFLMIVLFGRGNTINLNDYVVIETNGYNGYGTARIYVDWNSIKEKYGEKIEFTSSAKQEYGGFLTYGNAVEEMEYFIDVTMDKRENLSNGDELTYVWEINDEIYKMIDCKLKFKDGTYKVSDLEEVAQFDAFENLTVEFDGVGPAGYVSMNYEGEELSTNAFSCEPSSGLNNGDVVTVSISTEYILECVENYGVIPKAQAQEYTVAGLEKYVSSIDEISDESMEMLKKQAEDVYTAKIIGTSGDGEEFSNFTYVGNYVLTNKAEESYWSSNNQVCFVYKFDVHNTYTSGDESFDETNTLYWYVNFKDVTVDDEGYVDVDITNYATPSNRVEVDSGLGWFHSWYYNAYETYDELYKSVVLSNMSDYYIEENVEGDM